MESSTDTIPLLSLKEGTLCTFCDRLFRDTPDPAEITRRLSELISAAEYCQYCQLIQKGVEASAEAVSGAKDKVAILKHPLLQDEREADEVELQYVQWFDFLTGSIGFKVAHPRGGPFWATLTLLPAADCKLIPSCNYHRFLLYFAPFHQSTTHLWHRYSGD